MEPVERTRWQSTEAYERPDSVMPSVKSLDALALFAEMPTLNSAWPSIQAPQGVPVVSAVDVFAAAYRDPAPANTQISWTTGLADIVDPGFIGGLANTEPPDTG